MKSLPITNLERAWFNCQKCPKLVENRSKVVFGAGNSGADLFLLGEAPGQHEDKGGQPFIGRSGKLLDSILQAINIFRDDIWIGNTCLCRPPNNRNPGKKEIANCKPRLVQELYTINPKVVVVMGNIPLFAMTGLNGIGANRGWVESKHHPAVYCTYHPAAMLYDPGKKPEAWVDWQAIRDRLNER